MKQSLGWRIFAMVVAAAVLPFGFASLFQAPPPKQALHGFVDSIAVIGVIGYAFGVRFGPTAFWRVFAAVFLLFYVYNVFSGLPKTIGWMVRSDHPILLRLFFVPMLGGVVMWMGFIALALLRCGSWLAQPTRMVTPRAPRAIAQIVKSREAAI